MKPAAITIEEELAGSAYEPVRPLAVGGMGEVHVVRRRGDTALRVMKVVRVLDPSRADDLARRTLAEGRALRALVHPNIVQLLDVGLTAHGRPFLVTELLLGGTLKEEVDSRGPLPAGEVVDILVQALSGLDVAHARGLVHRDLKPLNIFYEQAPPNTVRRIKLLDFGIAKAVSPEAQERAGSALVATREGYFLGSPAFMAPEQAMGKPLDGRTDLYALGTVAFYLLTGRTVFRALSADQILAAHFFLQPDPPSTIAPHVSAELDAIVLKALSKEPKDRFRSAFEMQQALMSLPLTRDGETRTLRPAPEVVRAPSAADELTLLHAQRAASAEEAPMRVELARPPSAPVAPARSEEPWRSPPPLRPSTAQPPAAAPSIAHVQTPRWMLVLIALLTILVLLLAAMLWRGPPGKPTLSPWGIPPLVSAAHRSMAVNLPHDTIPASIAARLRTGRHEAVELADTTEVEVGPREPAVVAAAERLGELVRPRSEQEGVARVPEKPNPSALDFQSGEVFRGLRMGERFAKGGMSSLYDAKGTDGRELLVKVLLAPYRHPHFATIRDKLVAEGELLRALGGELPFLVNVHDVGIDERVGPFVVMDKLGGRPLDARLTLLRATGKTLPSDTVVRLGISIAASLHLMHERGVVHRDIKPGNILLPDASSKGRYGDVVIIDWGAAKSPYSSATATHDAAIGTAAYMAPEQILRGTITGQIDQYALSHVLVECLCGRHLLSGDDGLPAAEELANLQILGQFDSPPAHLVSPRLWAILARGLEKDFRKRYPSSAAFAQALREWLAAPDATAKAPAVLSLAVKPTVPKDASRNQPRPALQSRSEVPVPASRLRLDELSDRASLIVRSGAMTGTRFALAERHVIGRHPGVASIVLEDEGVSQEHAVLSVIVIDAARPVYNVRDAKSRNGTAVGQLRLNDGSDPEAPAGDTVAALRVGESLICDQVELVLFPAGRLLPNGSWQTYAEARENERLRDAALAAANPALRGGTSKLAATPVSPAAAGRSPVRPLPATLDDVGTSRAQRVVPRHEVELSDRWLAPTLLVMEAGDKPTSRRFHLGDEGVIGSSPDYANIVVHGGNRVSKRHAAYSHITGAEGGEITYAFEDLQSANGLWADPGDAPGKRRRVQAQVLHPMQSLWLGSAAQVLLLPPGRFLSPSEFQACDSQGRSVRSQPARHKLHPIAAAAILCASAALIAAVAWYLFQRLGLL